MGGPEEPQRLGRVILDNQRPGAELRGNTLRVYLYALRRGHVGVREVQRSLGFSTASLAQYHINKLAEMGLLKEENGEYQVAAEIKVDILKDFARLGRFLVPRFVFYAVFFSAVAVYMGIVTVQSYSSEPLVASFAALLGVAAVIFWYEVLRALRSVP